MIYSASITFTQMGDLLALAYTIGVLGIAGIGLHHFWTRRGRRQ